MNADTKLAAATFKLSASMPYLAHGLWAMKRFPRPGLGTVCVDNGWRFYYDPETIQAWELEEIVGVVYHELSHLLREHHFRGEQFYDPTGWNIAADLEINDSLNHELLGLGSLPNGAITPRELGLQDMRLAEEYYKLLPQNIDNATKGVAAGLCGSCAGGLSPSQLVEEPAEEGISKSDASLLRRIVAQEVRAEQKSRGRVPAGWARWAEQILEPKVNWRHELAASFRAASAGAKGMTDYSYHRPSRRQTVSKFVVLPTMAAALPSVAFIVDTSGSMSNRELSQALAEIRAILRLVPVSGLAVMSVDAAVQSTQQVFTAERITLLGGGGTDMSVGLLAVSRLRPKPNVCVVLTDGYTPWPDKPLSAIRTIVLLTSSTGNSPSWAKTILIEDLNNERT